MHIVASSIPTRYLIIEDVPECGDVTALFHDMPPGGGCLTINCQKCGTYSMTWRQSVTMPAHEVFLRWHTDCLCDELDPHHTADRSTLTLIVSAIKAALVGAIHQAAESAKQGVFNHV